MRMYDIIAKKRDGKELSSEEIEKIDRIDLYFLLYNLYETFDKR